MTKAEWDDQKTAKFFAIVFTLGAVPALFALYIYGAVILNVVLEMLPDRQLGSFAHFPWSLCCTMVILFGFWLLVQYYRRARGRPASVSQTTLWRLSTIQNGICALIVFVWIATGAVPAGFLSLGWVAWFAFLSSRSLVAAKRSAENP